MTNIKTETKINNYYKNKSITISFTDNYVNQIIDCEGSFDLNSETERFLDEFDSEIVSRIKRFIKVFKTNNIHVVVTLGTFYLTK